MHASRHRVVSLYRKTTTKWDLRRKGKFSTYPWETNEITGNIQPIFERTKMFGNMMLGESLKIFQLFILSGWNLCFWKKLADNIEIFCSSSDNIWHLIYFFNWTENYCNGVSCREVPSKHVGKTQTFKSRLAGHREKIVKKSSSKGSQTHQQGAGRSTMA